jgi:hypothetical protein
MFVAGEGTPDSPYLIETPQQIDLLNLCPYERDAHFRLMFVEGQGTSESPYLVETAEQIDLLNACPYEWDAHFRLIFVEGEGRQDSPYLICTADQLQLAGMCQKERDAHFKLTADIDLDPDLPGGKVFDKAVMAFFAGVFDGNGHTISHLTADGQDHVGLFGYLTSGAEVRDVGVVDVNITGSGSSVGGLVGYNYAGNVIRCYSSGTVSGTGSVGGLVGYSNGSITSSHSAGAVSGGSSVGGLVGWNEFGGTVTQSYSTGAVSGTGQDSCVGGLVGYNYFGALTRCYSTGEVNGTGGSVGGLLGTNYGGSVAHCYSTGTVSGSSNVGGLVGYNEGTVTHCYSTGAVSGMSPVRGLVGENYGGDVARCFSTGTVSGNESVGGLVGSNSGSVSRSYTTGAVDANDNVGGLVGTNGERRCFLRCRDVPGIVDDSYSIASVLGNSTNYGGLVGKNYAGQINRCFSAGTVLGLAGFGGLVGSADANDVVASMWDTETSGQSTSPGGTGKTTAEMQTAGTFLEAGLPDAAGWDFVGESQNGTENIWAICEGGDYPRLAWEFVIGDFDADADTDFADFCILAEHWLAADGSFWCGQGCDLTNDGSVNWQDLMVFVENWLR